MSLGRVANKLSPVVSEASRPSQSRGRETLLQTGRQGLPLTVSQQEMGLLLSRSVNDPPSHLHSAHARGSLDV